MIETETEMWLCSSRVVSMLIIALLMIAILLNIEFHVMVTYSVFSLNAWHLGFEVLVYGHD